MANKDSLIDCPLCGEKGACYSIAINEFHSSYLCLGCGFQSSDLMVDGEYDVEEYEKELPELYKDVKKTDSQNRVWYPSVTNIEDKGTVFLNGASKEDCKWSAIKSVKLTKAEKKLDKFKGKTWKSDSSSLKNFGNGPESYLDALEYIEVDF